MNGLAGLVTYHRSRAWEKVRGGRRVDAMFARQVKVLLAPILGGGSIVNLDMLLVKENTFMNNHFPREPSSQGILNMRIAWGGRGEKL